MLNQSSNRRNSPDEGPNDNGKTRSRIDWKRIANAGGVLTTWGLSVAWDVIQDKKKRDKIEKAYRIGKTCGKVSILIQQLQLPADLYNADAYRLLLWKYLKDRGVEKIEFEPTTTIGNLDILIDKALVINCVYSLEKQNIRDLAKATCAIAGQWMVWVLVFCSDPICREFLEQEIARAKTEYPTFVIQFM